MISIQKKEKKSKIQHTLIHDWEKKKLCLIMILVSFSKKDY